MMFSVMSALNLKRFIQFAHQQQAIVGSGTKTLEIGSQRRVQRELKGLILFLTHWIETSLTLVLLSKPHECWRWLDHRSTYTNFKKETWGQAAETGSSNQARFR